MSKKREKIARTEDEKKNLFLEIINIGRDLFGTRGSYGFNTHELARKLQMSQGNVYNYVESKRELWLAIRKEDYIKFKDDMEKIANNFQGSYLELIKKLGLFFLDFAKNKFRSFQMMFMIPVPPAKKIGKIEKNYQPHYPIYVLKELLEKAMHAKEIIEMDSIKLSCLLFAEIYGIASVEIALRLKNPIQEPPLKPEDTISAEEFREYALNHLLNKIKI